MRDGRKETETRLYYIKGCESRECPVSLLTHTAPRALALFRQITASEAVQKDSGAAMFGPDLSKWPAWAHDAVLIVQNARAEREASFREAIDP